MQRWNAAGRWVYPVGDPRILGHRGPDGEPGYLATRNIGRGSDRHRGADLSNRQGGGLVRAAAHGVVVAAKDAGNGYGLHVVIAHRTPDGALMLSVYAHLAPRSLRVATGEEVTLGQVLGRVGKTGVATSPHLHFEVRRIDRWSERWEKAGVLDPISYVAERLPTRDGDSTWARPYLVWAECAGVITPQDDPTTQVSRAQWHRSLATILCRPQELAGTPAPPLVTLAKAGVLAESDPVDPHDSVSWREIAHDLERAREIGLCLPPDSSDAVTRHAHCRQRFGAEEPRDLLRAVRRRKGHCTFADITLLLSDLGGP